MKCPKCGEEMILGRMETYDPYVGYTFNKNSDAPEDDKFVRMNIVGKKYIQLTPRSIFIWSKLAKAEAHYCPRCEFIILPIKEI